MSDITKFFGAATSNNNGESSEPMPKKAKASGVPQMALLKMVRKWEELEIELGKEHNDNRVVNKIWCVVCKEFGTAWRLTSYESKLELIHGYYDVMPGSAM